MINAPDRPMASHVVKRNDAIMLIVLLNSTGVFIAYLFGWETLLISIAEIMLGVAYSFRPFVFKDRFILKTLSIGAGGILASFFGGASSRGIDAGVVYAATMFLVLLFATSPINDLADLVGDGKQKRRTIPIVIGSANTVKLSIFASITPLVSSIFMLQQLNMNLLTVLLLGLLAARSVQLLLPLMKIQYDPKVVRRQHKKMVFLHFLLQGALAIGSLPL